MLWERSRISLVSLRGAADLADGLGEHHAAADPALGMEADQAVGGLAVGIAHDEERHPVMDPIGPGGVAEGDRFGAGANVGHVHRLDHRTAEDRFRLTRLVARLPEEVALAIL
jgi:hypothetical protein